MKRYPNSLHPYFLWRPSFDPSPSSPASSSSLPERLYIIYHYFDLSPLSFTPIPSYAPTHLLSFTSLLPSSAPVLLSSLPSPSSMDLDGHKIMFYKKLLVSLVLVLDIWQLIPIIYVLTLLVYQWSYIDLFLMSIVVMFSSGLINSSF